jgi:hypothetical protein
MCQVVNRNHMSVNMNDPDIVYIGRGSIWGNPFHIGGSGRRTREQVIEMYRKYLWERLRVGYFTLDMLKALDGKRLACYCAPKQCHGDIIKRAVRWAKEQQ